MRSTDQDCELSSAKKPYNVVTTRDGLTSTVTIVCCEQSDGVPCFHCGAFHLFLFKSTLRLTSPVSNTVQTGGALTLCLTLSSYLPLHLDFMPVVNGDLSSKRTAIMGWPTWAPSSLLNGRLQPTAHIDWSWQTLRALCQPMPLQVPGQVCGIVCHFL